MVVSRVTWIGQGRQCVATACRMTDGRVFGRWCWTARAGAGGQPRPPELRHLLPGAPDGLLRGALLTLGRRQLLPLHLDALPAVQGPMAVKAPNTSRT